MHAGVVFVLYRPTEKFLTHLATVRAGCPDVVAVDNTPDPDPALHERVRATGVRLLDNRNRGGLGGAFNRGARLLFEGGADLVVLLDQDSEVDEGFVADMVHECAAVPGAAYVVGPKIYEQTMGVYMGVAPPDDGPERDISDETSGLIPARMVISSGSAISAGAWDELGEFREDYFIELIDAEYGLRARERGVPVYVAPAVTLRQTWANTRKHGRMYASHTDASRRYYMIRNALDASRRYGYPQRQILPMAAREAVAVVALEKRKLGKLAAIAAGIVDGTRGRLGPFAECRPRLARRLGMA